ncbi:glycosyltransferase [Chloroflexota bacterium]
METIIWSKAGEKLLQQENIDAIISSSSPVTGHIIAKELKARYRTPWVADLRDLWSQNHNYSYSTLRRALDRRLELKTLSKADALVTVSQPWAEKLEALHKGKPIYSVTHGFDPAEVNNPPAKLMNKFAITYTGTIYSWQDPSKIMLALKDLILGGIINPVEVEIRFYGGKCNWLDREIEQCGLSSTAKQYGMVPKQMALERQRESQLLLVLKWEEPKERGTYTSKIFEYLGAGRPILATGGSEDIVNRLLNETKAGTCASTVEDIKRNLAEMYGEYKLKGEVTYRGDKAEINKYSHREMARKYAEILDRLPRE